ncbi:MAG: FRG domain-containing protein [Alphaproteobacteria bacterium]
MGIESVEEALTWEQFEKRVSDDIGECERKRQADVDEFASASTRWVYRGHSDKNWRLDTSLDRYLKSIKKENGNYKINDYYGLLCAIVPSIHSLTTYRFGKIDLDNLNYDPWKTPPHYELLSFVRHLGFPSPLLDWSYSPYVAAFFAFSNAIVLEDKRQPQDVAIYALQAWTENGQAYMGGDTRINDCGPYVESHGRHYRQRGTYTLCTVKKEGNHCLGSYEDVWRQNPENHQIIKFVISAGEKEKVLSRLFSMNINDYTLFGDDESLMRMLAFKEFREIW